MTKHSTAHCIHINLFIEYTRVIEENTLPFRKHIEKFGKLGHGTCNVQVQTVK